MNNQESDTNSNLDNSLQHCIASYTNSQEVIRFIDTKAGVLTGLVSAIAAFLVTAFNWLYTPTAANSCTLKSALIAHPLCFRFVVVLIFLSMLAALVAVISSVCCIAARGPKGPTTLLFPVTGSKDVPELDAAIARVKLGITTKQRVEEYAAQIKAVGGIIASKSGALRIAICAYLFQLVPIFVAIFVALICDIAS